MFLISKLRLVLGNIVEIDANNGLILLCLYSSILLTWNAIKSDIVYDLFWELYSITLLTSK